MNVIRTETTLKPLRKRLCQESNVGLMKLQFEFDVGKKLGKNWESGITSSYSKNKKFENVVRKKRIVPTSSSLLASTSRNCISKSGTRTTTGVRTTTGSSLFESVTGNTILALTTGRGDARFEVGMAALNVRCSHLILCQISDSQTYINTLSKLYLFDPIEVLMPDTMCERNVNRNILYSLIIDKFSEIEVTPISRVHFNDTAGFERIKSLCNPVYSSVELFIKQKYYALAAAASLLKYVEYAQRIVYTPKSMKIEFQGSPNATNIDLESARSLELVQSQCGQRNISLLGSLDRCSTPMGRKLLRANILQPPCEERVILERQAAVAELVSNRSLRALIQPIVRRLYGADRLLLLSITPVLHENNVQNAEQNLNYVLLLKNLLDVIPELGKILLNGESDFFCKIQKKLEIDEFRLMRERILETVHPDARSVTGYTSSNMQRCFAIRAGINDLLDIARQTYCELIDDMKIMVENLASKYKLTLSLSCNANLGYHVQMILPRIYSNAEIFDPPSEFIEVRKSKRVYTMTTNALATLSQQCKIACEELHLMSNVLLCDLLQSIREYIGCLFQLNADIAELDLITSLAQISSLQTYVRPLFGSKLELIDSRHPIMDVFGLDNPVPNNICASIPKNLCVISGPNMSGKSTYLKQIVLLHIMAQLGCFVPAKQAMFRITNLVFCKIVTRDDIECNASTFSLEMKEAQYILRSITPSSLIILDELCKGTAIEEGASIAWAICEKLLNTTAFIFAATHFSNLTKLEDLYFNVTNRYFETINVQGSKTDNCHHRLTYTHRLKSGVAPTDDYGIALAELSGLPKTVTEKARKYASEQIIIDRIQTTKSDTWEKTCYATLINLYELLENDEFNWEEATLLIQNFLKLWKQKGGKDNVQENEKMANENETDIQENDKCKHSTDIVSDTTIHSRTNFDEMGQYETTINVESKEIPASTHIACSNASMKTLEIQSETIYNRHNNSSNECYISPNRRFDLTHSLSFHSITTENISNKFSTSDNLKCSLCEEFTESCDSIERICSITNKTNSSLSFIPSHDELLSVQMSTPRIISKSPKLYEYCLSDDDFEVFTISPNTN